MCWKCGCRDVFPPPVSRSAVCPQCGADVRSCRNCAFFDEAAHYGCRETVDEPVRDKERANFCGFFSHAPGAGGGSDAAVLKARAARGAFDSLFS